ncbi:hypothetical protein LTR84_012881 [Exophiala bonariae]|uniref:BHLH domain-containing protein n=1 Tax=Exophiala bonariae TaxID=1690606 RepID=A0AAV9NH08_9EURO|nr:hypothetical protein LTR84_012881 [Exophiala bonariae]
MPPKKTTDKPGEKSRSAIYGQKRRDNTREAMEDLQAIIPQEHLGGAAECDYTAEGRVIVAAKAYITALQSDCKGASADKTAAGETITTDDATVEETLEAETLTTTTVTNTPFAPTAAPAPAVLAQLPAYRQLFATFTRTMQFIAGIVAQSGGEVSAETRLEIADLNDRLFEFLDQLKYEEMELIESGRGDDDED